MRGGVASQIVANCNMGITTSLNDGYRRVLNCRPSHSDLGQSEICLRHPTQVAGHVISISQGQFGVTAHRGGTPCRSSRIPQSCFEDHKVTDSRQTRTPVTGAQHLECLRTHVLQTRFAARHAGRSAAVSSVLFAYVQLTHRPAGRIATGRWFAMSAFHRHCHGLNVELTWP